MDSYQTAQLLMYVDRIADSLENISREMKKANEYQVSEMTQEEYLNSALNAVTEWNVDGLPDRENK